MRKYLERETSLIKACKRSLLSASEVINLCTGYLQCLVDLGELPEDRLSEEIEIMTKKVLG